MPQIVTLTTDFGTKDGFSAQMKGVILGINPGALVIDVTHEIEPFALLEGALVLKGISRYFAVGTVHIAVVDPGVGSSRRGIAIRSEDRFYVGPDNGLFSFLVSEGKSREIRELQNESYFLTDRHPTFHGRDIFAPTAAHLSLGKPFESVGPIVDDPVTLLMPQVRPAPSGLEGEVIYVDRFGNLTTNIDATFLARPAKIVEMAGLRIQGVSRFFSEVPEGNALALINSFGFLEIAVNRGNASKQLGIKPGEPVKVEWGGES
jgi:S-adenosylmethionine hydrolase